MTTNEIKMVQIWIDGFDYGIDDSIAVYIEPHEKDLIEQQIMDSQKINRCDRCRKIHSNVKPVLKEKGRVYNEGRSKVPDEYEYLCSECK